MNFTSTRRRGLRCLAAAASAPLLILAPSAAQAGQAPITWTFDKCQDGSGVWTGSATSDGTTDSLRTQLTGAWPVDDEGDPTTPILHVTFNWEVQGVLLANLRGILNTSTGSVVMNGVVVDGAYAGSRMHEEGQLYDAERFCFAGTFSVLPATA